MKVYTFNEDFKQVETKWVDVFQATQRIQKFFDEVQSRFVERDGLIEIFKYAMLLQEHVLIYGVPGTAKTAIADTVIKNIKDSKYWSHDLSKFTVDTHVFGNFDLLKAQETGQFHHQTEGSLLEANFANLGELLDANTALLRSLLRVLNEREFLRGPQHLKVPLMTAIANTNGDPTEKNSRSKELEALLDRFLFWYEVGYLKTSASRMKMLSSFMDRKDDKEMPPLSIEDIRLVSGVVLRNNLLTNKYILSAYEQLARTFGVKRGYPISDRRLCKAAQIMEASALLNGSQMVGWGDLASVKHILVDRDGHSAMFDESLETVIEHWMEKENTGEIDKEVQALEAIGSSFPRVDVSQATDEQLVKLNRRFQNIRHRLEVFDVTTPQAHSRREELLKKVDGLIANVWSLINKAGT